MLKLKGRGETHAHQKWCRISAVNTSSTANREPDPVQGLVMPRYMPEPRKILEDQPSDMASHRVP